MWRSFWRSIDRFSLQHFKHVIAELRGIKVVDRQNKELLVDLLQSIVEIVTYGDRHDPMIFECFMEYQVLAEFVRVLRISDADSRIEAPLLQYLSIMIQNMDSEHAIYYCLSNDYINNIVVHEYNFDTGDLASYYVSFLRAVSSKINRGMLCLLVKVHGDAVVSFPLYTEALKFAQHGEKMIQAAIRAFTLNIYNVSDQGVYKFVTTPPVSQYFSDLVYSFKEQCIHLDSLVHATENMCNSERRKKLLLESDKIVDDLYYFKDIICVGESCLIKAVMQNILNLLVFPTLLPLLQSTHSDGSNLSAITSLYVVSRLLQVVGGKDIAAPLADVILYPHMSSGSESKGVKNYNRSSLCEHLAEPTFSNSTSGLMDLDVPPKRTGVLAFILSDNYSLLLASLFLLLTLAETKDLEYIKEPIVTPSATQHGMNCGISAPQAMDRSILMEFMPQVMNALLKVLASETVSMVVKWHIGWFLRILLLLQGKMLDENNIHLFNTSYEQSRERFKKELDGCWYDSIMDTVQNEWENCKKALEEPFQSKDSFFLLEISVCLQNTDGIDMTSSHAAWHKMVDAVKGFLLHLQLRALNNKQELLEKPLTSSMNRLPVDDGNAHASNLSSANFGADVSIGSGIPCRIALSNAGIRDIYLIPVASGTSGKLLLVEKHPFHSQRGIVIAIAPLAGLSPKIDEDHPTWLHLTIREFNPPFHASKSREFNPKVPNHTADGRWTLGFLNGKACEAARLMILEETNKQRSSVRIALASLLQGNFLGDFRFRWSRLKNL